RLLFRSFRRMMVFTRNPFVHPVLEKADTPINTGKTEGFRVFHEFLPANARNFACLGSSGVFRADHPQGQRRWGRSPLPGIAMRVPCGASRRARRTDTRMRFWGTPLTHLQPHCPNEAGPCRRPTGCHPRPVNDYRVVAM